MKFYPRHRRTVEAIQFRTLNGDIPPGVVWDKWAGRHGEAGAWVCKNAYGMDCELRDGDWLVGDGTWTETRRKATTTVPAYRVMCVDEFERDYELAPATNTTLGKETT